METNLAGKTDSGGIPFVPERGFYQPSTEETWDSYQALQSVLEQQLGGYPRVVMCGVADEVLSVLKCVNIKSPIEKKAEIEKLVGPLLDHTFDQLVMIGGCINDYYKDQPRSEKDNRAALFVPEKEFYQPRTEETWTSYKLLLDVIIQQIGHQPQIVLCMVAHEILSIMNGEEIKEGISKRVRVENLIYAISDETFNLLVFIGGLIWDYGDCLEGNNSSQRVVREELDQQPIQRFERERVFEVNDGSEFDQKVENGDDDDDDDYDDDDDDEVVDSDDQVKELTVDDIDFNINLDSGDEMNLDQAQVVDEEDKDWVMVDFDE